VADQNVELVRGLASSFGTPGHYERLAEFYAEDVEYRPVEGWFESRPCHDRDDLSEFLRGFEDAWQDVRIEPTRIEAVGDRVIARFMLYARGRASGLEMEGRVFQVFTIRDGLIVRQEDFLDSAKARRAAGLDA
jgi:ketosteroid isomerase-like protein